VTLCRLPQGWGTSNNRRQNLSAMKTQGPKDARGQIHSQKMRCRNRTENSLHSKRHRKDRCIIRHLARVRHVHHARNYRDRRADLPRLGHSTSTRNPMADWQMRTKRPLREPVREEAGPTLKNYITPAGLQRLKDEHRFLLSRERPAVVLGAALGQAICVLMHRVDMYAHLCIY